MAKSITYLSVPYAQKDMAKALGARWDAANKKWYVPVDKDIAPFAQWLSDFVPEQPTSKISTTKKTASATPNSGVFTFPSIPNFVPYSGEEAPWD